MTVELTEQQRQLVNEQAGRPVEVVDPDTSCTYMLVPSEQFEKVRSLLDDAAPASAGQLSFEIPPGIRRSQEAFSRELPELLKKRKFHRQWVCYYGDERIGIARKNLELYQRCFTRGLKRAEFYVGYIQARETPPWEPTVVDQSLFEAI